MDNTFWGACTTLERYMKQQNIRASKAEAKLREIFDGSPPRYAKVKENRRGSICAAAERVFPEWNNPTSLANNKQLNPPAAVCEMSIDALEILVSQIQVQAGPLNDKPQKCATCGRIKPGEEFYNYGSPSCRSCNTVGLRRED